MRKLISTEKHFFVIVFYTVINIQLCKKNLYLQANWSNSCCKVQNKSFSQKYFYDLLKDLQ